jgi:3-oxoacyl-[acyl-carrier protein] reductase
LGAPQVRVNEIMLGIFESRHAQGTRGWDLLSATQKEALLDHTLLGRTGRIEDVVKAVRFLIEEAPFMTGATLRLDGGYVLGGDKVLPMPKGVVS